MERKVISELVIHDILNELDEAGLVGLENTIMDIIKRDARSNGEWTNFYLGVYHDYDECYLQVYGERLETDKEFEQRKRRSESSKRSAAKREETKKLAADRLLAEEKALYEKLKKKFG